MLEARLAEAAATGRPLLVSFTASCGPTPCRQALAAVDAFVAGRGADAPLRLDIDIDRCAQDVGVSAVPTFRWHRPGAGAGAATEHVGLAGLREWLAHASS